MSHRDTVKLMRYVFVLIFILYSNIGHTHTLSINHSNWINVSGDREELNDWRVGDDYSHFSVDTDDATSLKFSFAILNESSSTYPESNNATLSIYAEYLISDFKYENGEIEKGKYQSFTSGVSFLFEQPRNDLFGTYVSFGLGVGVSRFDLTSIKDKAVGEGFVEGGISLLDTIYLGVGGKYQIVGYPTETMATMYNAYLGMSVKF